MLDSVRLWPAAALLVRVTAAETEWYGETLPIGSKVLIPVAAHHRARRLPHANRFAPDLWLDDSAAVPVLIAERERVGVPVLERRVADLAELARALGR